MSLPLSNGTYLIKNINKNKYLTLDNTTVGTVVVVADKKTGTDLDKQKWILRDQGYGGGELQMISLQSSTGLGFFAASKQTSEETVKYTQYAWSVKLENVSDDNVTIRYTKGSKDLVLSVNNSTLNGELANRLDSDSKQQWLFEIADQSINISSAQNIVTTASDSTIIKQFYFGYKLVSSKGYVSVQLSTNARNQGYRTTNDAGIYSWFEISVLTKDLKLGQTVTDQIKKVDGKPLTWISHTIPLNSTYTNLVGPIFDKNHDLWKNIEVGDIIAVLSCAQYREWKCDACSGTLDFRKLGA